MAGILESSDTNRSGAAVMHDFQSPSGDQHLVSTLQQVWRTGELSDVIFRTKRAVNILAHRIALLAKCSSLRDQLVAAERIPVQIQLVEYDASVVKLVLDYIYGGQMSVPETELGAVADLARRLGITELYRRVKHKELEEKKPAADTCLAMLAAAQDIGYEDGKERLLNFALENFMEVRDSDAFLTLDAELLQKYLGHPHLSIGGADERLNTVLLWMRQDSTRRLQQLPKILDALPLGQVTRGCLKLALVELKNAPAVCSKLKAALDLVQRRGSSRRERCLVFVGASVSGSRSDEVFAVRLEHGFELVSLGRMGVAFDHYSCSCVMGDYLYAVGVGANAEDIWCYDMLQRTSRYFGRLATTRDFQVAAVGTNDSLCILGGRSPPKTGQAIDRVELAGTTTGVCRPLKHPGPRRLACVRLPGPLLLVIGGLDTQGQHMAEVYSQETKGPSQAISLPGTKSCWLFGAVEIRGYVVVVGTKYTAVIPLADVLQGRQGTARLAHNYITPNWHCGVTSSADGSSVVLVAGEFLKGRPHNYVYQASVDDIVNDTPAGWQAVSVTWNKGSCVLYGGHALADIVIP